MGRGGKERLGSESGAYISAGTNCPIIHSVRRQRCSSVYPRPLLLPLRLRRRSPPTSLGVCFAFRCSLEKKISHEQYLYRQYLSIFFNIRDIKTIDLFSIVRIHFWNLK